MVERFFAEITSRRIRRSSYSSVDDLKAAIFDYLGQHNEKPKRFKWTKTAEDKVKADVIASHAPNMAHQAFNGNPVSGGVH